VTTGSLTSYAAAGSNSSLFPQGRILRENGKRVHAGGSYPGVSTLMVGVFDNVTFTTGYIDPTSPLFTTTNGDRAVWPSTNPIDPGPGGKLDLAPPVYTNGNIITNAGISSLSSIVYGAQSFNPKLVNLSTIATSGLTINLDASIATVFQLNMSTQGQGGGTTTSLNATNVQTGMPVYLEVNSFAGVSTTDTVVFGNNIREINTLSGMLPNKTYMFSFVGIGNTLCELSRTSGGAFPSSILPS